MGTLFHVLVHDPLYNLLVFLYDTVSFEDFGIAIILTTVLLKLVLYPLSHKQIESQKKLQDLQPKIKELQRKHKDDKETQSRELMNLYRKHKINPLGGCLPLIVQIIFFIALWKALSTISSNNFQIDGNILYGFVGNPGTVKEMFLGILNLSQPSIWLAVVTAAAQFWQMKMMIAKNSVEKEQSPKDAESKEPDMAKMMNTQMLYIFPALTLWMGATFHAGLVLYWLVSTVFMIIQQHIVFIHSKATTPHPSKSS